MNIQDSECSVREEEMHNAMHEFSKAIKNVHYLYKKLCDKYLILLNENNELKTAATKKLDIQKPLTTINFNSDKYFGSEKEIYFPEFERKCKENFVTPSESPEKDVSKIFVATSPILSVSTANKGKSSLTSLNSLKNVSVIRHLNKDLSFNRIKTLPNLSESICNKTKCSAKTKRLRQMKLVLQTSKDKPNCIVTSKEQNSSMEMTSNSKEELSVKISSNSNEDFGDVTEIHADDIVEGSPRQKAVSKKLRDILRRNKKRHKTLKDSDHPTSPSIASVSDNNEPSHEESKSEMMKLDLDSDSLCSKRKRLRSYSSLADETFFSPAEPFTKRLQHDDQPAKNVSLKDHEEEHIKDVNKVPSPERTIESRQKVLNPRNILDDFDRLPEKKKTIPENARIGKSVRRKEDRQKLDGWSCADCKLYYAAMELTEAELKARMNKCSRHKSAYKENYETPEGFWNPLFSDSGASDDSDHCGFVK